MLFSKSSIVSVLALISSVASQVIVTVTNTVTVVTVTVTPLSTSTATVVVTVSGTPPPTLSTSTSIVTVTASPPPATTDAQCPGAVGERCGGYGRKHCETCVAYASCSKVNGFYSLCVKKPTVTTFTSTIYAGLLPASA